jgi:hypothetical protein
MNAISLLACLMLAGVGDGQDADAALHPAMGPYYAALVTSAHGNIEATERQLLLFQARWETASKLARTSVPDALRQDPDWGRALDSAVTAATRARAALRVKDTGGAHAELESIRLQLQEVRARHRLETLDDRLTGFHGAMERLISRISARNEIVLESADWEAIAPQVANADRAFQQIDAAASSALKAYAPWNAAFDVVRKELAVLAGAVTKRDGFAASTVGERLHERYYELLLVLAKRN